MSQKNVSIPKRRVVPLLSGLDTRLTLRPRYLLYGQAPQATWGSAWRRPRAPWSGRGGWDGPGPSHRRRSVVSRPPWPLRPNIGLQLRPAQRPTPEGRSASDDSCGPSRSSASDPAMMSRSARANGRPAADHRAAGGGDRGLQTVHGQQVHHFSVWEVRVLGDASTPMFPVCGEDYRPLLNEDESGFRGYRLSGLKFDAGRLGRCAFRTRLLRR